MTDIDRKLNKFLFPVSERKVYVESLIGEDPKLTRDYKAIVRQDKNKLISVMNSTYNVVPNSEVIKPLLEQLHRLDSKWYLDKSHSFVNNKRMRLQVTFPDLTFNDGRSEIALSLYLHNSYDGSEGVRLFWGAIRFICGNGMVFGKVLGQFYGKHTAGLNLTNLKEQVEKTYDTIPVIKRRIDLLQNTIVSSDLKEEVTQRLGKSISKYVTEQEGKHRKTISQWMLYNYLTYYISHMIDQRMRAQYQIAVSRLFQL